MKIYFRQMAPSAEAMNIVETVDASGLIKGRKDIQDVSLIQANLKAQTGLDQVLHVHGVLSATLHMSCARCLKPLSHEVHVDFDERFKHTDDPELNVETEDEDIWYIGEDFVELTPYIEESFVINLPFSVLCKDDCKGLCQNCGADLNEGECGCNREVIDPRLAALGDFFKK